MATGGGLFVVDVDPRNGGTESLTRLIATHGPFPRTAEAHTGADGRHFVFVAPRNASSGIGLNLEPGIDIKGERGYIVVAPSIHPDTGLEYPGTNTRERGSRMPLRG